MVYDIVVIPVGTESLAEANGVNVGVPLADKALGTLVASLVAGFL